MRERVVALLWNGRTRRPRLPWRIVAVVVMITVLGVGAGVFLPLLRPSVRFLIAMVAPGTQAAVAAGDVVFIASQVITFVGATYIVGRFVDRRSFRDFGFRVDRGWWLDAGFGLVLGALLISGVFLVEFAMGWVVVTDTFRLDRSMSAFWAGFAITVVTFGAVAITEELFARGYLITNLAEGLTWFDRIGRSGAVGLAIVGSSLLFAWGHLSNPNASLASTVGILAGGVMLAAGFVLTGELAIPIGIHVTWNLFQGPVYGFPVSGIDFGLSILAIEQGGPSAITGGAFGPEAGLLGIAANLVGICVIAAWVRRREGHLRVHPGVTTPDLRVEGDA